jgi:hypothetical protein
MKLALLVFNGSRLLKIEVNHLRTTIKKMPHNSPKYPEFDLVMPFIRYFFICIENSEIVEVLYA